MSEGFILLFDPRAQNDFQKVSEWFKKIERVKGADLPRGALPIVLVGSKCDRSDKGDYRYVSIDESIEYANSIAASYFEMSALTNINCEEIVADIVRQIHAKRSYNSLQSKD